MQSLGKFFEHSKELGRVLLTLIVRCLWEFSYSNMKDSPLVFPVVPQKDGALVHRLKVGTFPANFVFPSVLDPFLRADEEVARSW